jgi:hypothetical protein
MKIVGVPPAWTPPELLHFFSPRFYFRNTVWLGIASLLTYLISYTLVLSWADFSYVQPASAFAYAIVALAWPLLYLGRYVSITALDWHCASICLGVLFVGNTALRTTERH